MSRARSVSLSVSLCRLVSMCHTMPPPTTPPHVDPQNTSNLSHPRCACHNNLTSAKSSLSRAYSADSWDSRCLKASSPRSFSVSRSRSDSRARSSRAVSCFSRSLIRRSFSFKRHSALSLSHSCCSSFSLTFSFSLSLSASLSVLSLALSRLMSESSFFSRSCACVLPPV